MDGYLTFFWFWSGGGGGGVFDPIVSIECIFSTSRRVNS